MNDIATDNGGIISSPPRSGEVMRRESRQQPTVLDTVPQGILDDLTSIAARFCDVPVAVISLVGGQGQMLEVRPESGPPKLQAPLDLSLCAHALGETDLLVVSDVTKDPRFSANPQLAGEAPIRFYAGAPLVTPGGVVLGTLSVIDHVPRTLTAEQEETLRVLARLVTAQFELRRQGRELLENGWRLRAVFEAEPDGVSLLGPDATLREINAAGLALIEAEHPEQMAGKTLMDLVVSEDREILRTILERSAAGDSGTLQFRITGLKGARRWLEMKWVPFHDEATGTPLVLGITRDITDRKRNEERFHQWADSNMQGVMFANANGEITGANDAFLKIVGYSRADLEAGLINLSVLTPPEFADSDRRSEEEVAAKGVSLPFEKEYIRKDGSRVPVLVGSAVFEDQQEGFTFVLDLTDRKSLEQQLLSAQRMESIRTLAGGIGHDLNNVLAPIIMALDLFKMRFPDAGSQELISLIDTSAHRGAEMVRQVTAFARGVEGRRVEVRVRQLIDELEIINSDSFLRSIQVIKFIPQDLYPLMGDPAQLQKVLWSLCENARDAMPTGGKLTISAANLTLDKHFAGMHIEATPGPYVLLQVVDTGSGISPETLDRIFDPFYTTKEVGKGPGLGLSVALSIVKSHGGFIRTFSEIGKGTTFKIYLPARPEATPAPAPAAITDGLPRGSGELILVVDDEAPVRLVTRHLLETFGYRVVVAADGEEALAVHARLGPEIAAVLTDMMMPGMNGPKTIQGLRQYNPRLPIIAASGVPPHGPDAATIHASVNRFLPKPYSAEALLKVLRELVGEGKSLS